MGALVGRTGSAPGRGGAAAYLRGVVREEEQEEARAEYQHVDEGRRQPLAPARWTRGLGVRHGGGRRSGQAVLVDKVGGHGCERAREDGEEIDVDRGEKRCPRNRELSEISIQA